MGVILDSDLVQRPLQAVRAAQLETSARGLHRRRGGRPRVFCLDLHIGLFPDIKDELEAQGVDVTYWSISHHNFVTRRAFRRADVVRHVNSRTWRALDIERIHNFRRTYRRFLDSFDGFVSCFTPTFAELYAHLDRPQLIVAGTRYEAPYTSRPDDWGRFDECLTVMAADGRLHLLANNVGDRDYLARRTGLTATVAPSLCDWLPPRRTERGALVALTRDARMTEDISRLTQGRWSNLAAASPRRVSNREALSRAAAVFINPYNNTLMTLFELATAGVPVIVPSAQLCQELRRQYGSTLSELSWYQVLGLPVDELADDDPNNYASPTFADWWLARADFLDRDLMPNATRIDSLADLDSLARRPPESPSAATLASRNQMVRQRRHDAVAAYVRSLTG